MPTNNNSKDISCLEAVKELFIKAENAIKLIETELEYSLDVTAVNQLRYAGRHIIESVTNEDISEEQLRRAASHCQRSIYDCFDIGIQFQIRCHDKFKQDYMLVDRVDDYVDNYDGIFQELESAKQFIREVRTGAPEDRHEYYDRAEVHYKTLEGNVNVLDESRRALNSTLATKEQQILAENRNARIEAQLQRESSNSMRIERTQTRTAVVSIVVAVSLGLPTSLIAYKQWFSDDTPNVTMTAIAQEISLTEAAGNYPDPEEEIASEPQYCVTATLPPKKPNKAP